MTISRSVGHLAIAVGLALVLGGCSLAQQPTARPTLPPPPTLAPDATAQPTAAPCSGGATLPDELVTVDDFPLADAYEVTDVAWTGSNFVAVGFRSLPGEGYDGPRQGVIWSSCDGIDWQEFVDPAFQYITPLNVDTLGDTTFILGSISTCGPAYEGICENDVAEAGNVLMRSVAGGPWQRLAQDPEMQVAYDTSMQVLGSRLVVHGTADDENVSYTLWQSADGETWQKTTDVAGMDPIDSMVEQGEGMIAFGTVYPDDLSEGALTVATSSDGRAFTAVQAPDVPGALIVDATTGPGGYSAVGVGYPDLEDFGQLGIALYSPDGSTWTQATASDDSFIDTQLDHVHALPDGSGYVSVGFRLDADDFASQQGALWHSADGRTWQVLTQFGSSTSLYTSSAMGANGLIVFSADETDTGEEIESSVSVYFAPVASLTP